MIVTQSYAARSSATLDAGGLGLILATERGRPPVRLHATMRDGLAYARLMTGLYALVTSNLLTPRRDRSAYFEWVHERYLEELTDEQARAVGRLPGLLAEREALRTRLKEAQKRIGGLGQGGKAGEWEGARGG